MGKGGSPVATIEGADERKERLIGNNWPLQNAHVRGWLPPIGATVEAVKDPT